MAQLMAGQRAGKKAARTERGKAETMAVGSVARLDTRMAVLKAAARAVLWAALWAVGMVVDSADWLAARREGS